MTTRARKRQRRARRASRLRAKRSAFEAAYVDALDDVMLHSALGAHLRTARAAAEVDSLGGWYRPYGPRLFEAFVDAMDRPIAKGVNEEQWRVLRSLYHVADGSQRVGQEVLRRALRRTCRRASSTRTIAQARPLASQVPRRLRRARAVAIAAAVLGDVDASMLESDESPNVAAARASREARA